MDCPPANPRVVGCGVEPATDFGVVVSSRPKAGDSGWLARVRNDGNSLTLTATVFAICVT